MLSIERPAYNFLHALSSEKNRRVVNFFCIRSEDLPADRIIGVEIYVPVNAPCVIVCVSKIPCCSQRTESLIARETRICA